MDTIDIITLVLVLAAILIAFELGRRIGEASAGTSQVRWTGGNVAPTQIIIEYRNATGRRTRNKIHVLGYMPRTRGRSCLFALCNNSSTPRTFRIDRIVSIRALGGAVINKRQFLEEQLGVKAQGLESHFKE